MRVVGDPSNRINIMLPHIQATKAMRVVCTYISWKGNRGDSYDIRSIISVFRLQRGKMAGAWNRSWVEKRIERREVRVSVKARQSEARKIARLLK